MPNGARALLVVLLSSAVGIAYFVYLTVEPFPPDLVRLVPLAWFAACLGGWVSSVRGLRSGIHRWSGWYFVSTHALGR